MSASISGVHPVSHAVALGRMQASRREERHSRADTQEATGIADTVPLWFRSEAFAEDVSEQVDHAAGQEHARRAGGLVLIDRQVMATGAAVLRKTLQAFKLQRW
jgi:hypothetical protein